MTQHVRFISRADLADFIGKARPNVADAISFAEARMALAFEASGGDGYAYTIDDVHAEPANNGEPGWSVTFTYTESEPKHVVVIRGGHSLYCATCDKDVCRIPESPYATIRLTDTAHVAPVAALLVSTIDVVAA